MRDEAEVEIVDSAEHCEGGQNHNTPSETGALVEVTFQKNPNQVLKYLEAEPKVLGITQILLSLFLISISITSLKKSVYIAHIIFCSLSTVGIIAGSVAIAAQSLRLSKLKACLGMQIVMCVVSVTSFFMSLGVMIDTSVHHPCWEFQHHKRTSNLLDICERLVSAYEHVKGLEMLALGAQIAISATLSAFCCKFIQCCSPRSSISAYEHVKGLEMLALGAQIAISATLSAFCCKFIQCCSPRSSIPTIVLNAPSAPQ